MRLFLTKVHLTLSVLSNELKIVLIIDFLNSDFTGSRSHIVLLYFVGEEKEKYGEGGARRCTDGESRVGEREEVKT